MPTELAKLLVYGYSLWYAVVRPCPDYTPLPVGSLNAKQYLGRWYFSAAVSGREEELQMFRMMDNTVFTMQTTDLHTLLLTGDMRIGENCVRATWTYNILSGRDDLQLQGRSQRQTFLLSGALLNCSDCIILQEVEPALNRYMLYGRQQVIPEDVIEDFQEMFACHNMTAFVRLPQNKSLCLSEDPPGLDPAGPDPPGLDPAGPDPAGPDPAGPDLSGPDLSGPDPAGPDPAGPDPAGPDLSGPDPTGPDPAGPDLSGPDPAGPDPVGPDPAGPDLSGPHPVEPDPAGPDLSQPGLSGMDLSGPLRADLEP